jgi:cytochrome b pre-mRNA-processing protein 3
MRGWLRPDAARKSAEELYAAAVAQARRPEFYASLGVPDTIDGRFELVALHTFLVLRRLKGQGQAAEAGQALVDLFIQDMDASLRELGAGDLGVGRKVKAMAQAFYGRIAAYDSGLAGSAATLEDALRRNLFGTNPEPGPDPATVSALAEYVRRESAGAASPIEALSFGAPPAPQDGASGPGPGR